VALYELLTLASLALQGAEALALVWLYLDVLRVAKFRDLSARSDQLTSVTVNHFFNAYRAVDGRMEALVGVIREAPRLGVACLCKAIMGEDEEESSSLADSAEVIEHKLLLEVALRVVGVL